MTKLTTSDQSKVGNDAGELDTSLRPHAPAFGKSDAAKRRVHEDGGEQDAGRAPYAVHGEHVEESSILKRRFTTPTMK